MRLENVHIKLFFMRLMKLSEFQQRFDNSFKHCTQTKQSITDKNQISTATPPHKCKLGQYFYVHSPLLIC